jgi:hypothetical protein
MSFRSKVIRLASSYPGGSHERKALLEILADDYDWFQDLLEKDEEDARPHALFQLSLAFMDAEKVLRSPSKFQFKFAPKSGKRWLKVVHDYDDTRPKDYFYPLVDPKMEGLESGDPVALYFNAEFGQVADLHPQYSRSTQNGPRYNEVGYITAGGRKVPFQRGSWVYDDQFEDVLKKMVLNLSR